MTISNERREELCLSAIDAVELYSLGEGIEPLTLDLTAARELLEGMVLYAQLLEVSISVVRGYGGDVDATRAAARDSATVWRKATSA